MNLVGCCKEDEFLGTCKLMEDNIQVGSILLVDEGKDKISIWNFFIHEEHRNKKYGYKAIQEVIKLYPNKTFWLYVVKENIIAFNLYKKLGFTIEKEYSYKYDMILKN